MSIAQALMLLLAPSPAPPPVWQGVWQGRVGDLPVRACLARRGDSYSVGAYYYLSKLRPIMLDQQAGTTVWLEGEGISHGPPRPRWTFATIEPARLTGEWTDGGRRLPFALTRMTAEADAEPCGSAAFNAPRLRPLRLRTTRAAKDGVAYTKLTFDPGPAFPDVVLETFALDGGGAATRRIDAALRRLIPATPARGDWYGCVAGGLDAHGSDGDYQLSIEPTLIAPRWLAATMDLGSDCGGAHPNSDTVSLTFDRRTGAAVDLADWLNGTSIERRRDGKDLTVTVRPALRRAIIAHAGEIEEECREPTESAEFWDIGLARRGLIFTPGMPHVLTPCANPTLMPWSALSPYLSAAGRAGAASLRR